VAALVGDFNGDGSSDLLIAHNGDGHVTLLTGGPGGPELAASFARADVPHPTDLALASHGEERDIYVTGEGQESALLLTSFGVAIPVLVVPEPPLTSVFVVNGPGIEQRIDIPALPTAGAALLSNPFPSAEGRGDSALAPGESIQAIAGTQAAVTAGPGGAVAVATASSGSGPEDEPPGEDTPAAEVPPGGFRMWLDEAFRRRWSGAADGISRGPAGPADLLAAVDLVLVAWQDSAAGLPAKDSAELIGAVVGRVPLALSEPHPDEMDAGLGDAGVRAASGRDAVWLAEPTVARDALLEAEAAPAWPALAAAVLFLASADHGHTRRNGGDAPRTTSRRAHGGRNGK
jgi:hypothetical protein